jgi:hypothetical protein
MEEQSPLSMWPDSKLLSNSTYSNLTLEKETHFFFFKKKKKKKKKP